MVRFTVGGKEFNMKEFAEDFCVERKTLKKIVEGFGIAGLEALLEDFIAGRIKQSDVTYRYMNMNEDYLKYKTGLTDEQ